ncbi:hypothetical protein ACM7YY_10000 [Pseudomonas aeruginosa]
MNTTLWTAARFPDGSWSTGGAPDDPDYANCTVYRVPAKDSDEALRLGKAEHRKAVRKAANASGVKA